MGSHAHRRHVLLLTERGEQLRTVVGVWKGGAKGFHDRNGERHFMQREQHEQTFGSKGVLWTQNNQARLGHGENH